MVNVNDVAWFKARFGARIGAAVAGKPYDVDMLTAIACQETGYIWRILRNEKIDEDRLLELCVGDTLDASGGRSAFPQNKAKLLAKPNGQEMFDLAHQALVEMAAYVPGYKKAASNPDKFCHGYGIFQYDLQFFLKDPRYFLEKRYAKFDLSLGKCLLELEAARPIARLGSKTRLTDYEFACVAIAYNTGRFDPAKGLKQGYFDKSKYYGEYIAQYLAMARSVATSTTIPVTRAAAGRAELAAPTLPSSGGRLLRVASRVDMLPVRSAPSVPAKPGANVVGRLPDGYVVREAGGGTANRFREIETSLAGAHIRGFASAELLKPAGADADIPIVAPLQASAPPMPPAVELPHPAGVITRRTAPAGPLSLNEPGQPGRKGTTPSALRQELAAIVDWLGVDDASHLRYKPGPHTTFCNIYVHDYCFLAGTYLPRVWWTPGALVAIAQGRTVTPKIGQTVDEQRANDLFRWLRDFGPSFGWRQTGTLDKLQSGANTGGIGLIVARRVVDGASGHIVAVVPESDAHQAKRNAAGEVVAPLQSQAGSVNFRYGTGRPDWWKGAQFAESAFWLHA